MRARFLIMGYAAFVLPAFALPITHVEPGLGNAGPLILAHGDAEWIMRGQYYTFDPPKRHCCGPSDCHRLNPGEVVPSGNSFKIVSPRLGVFAEWPASKTYQSENGDYWVCFTPSGVHCLFAPAGG